MSNALARPAPIRVEDYLEGETLTDIKHEYLDGEVVAMGGASARHGLVAGAFYGTSPARSPQGLPALHRRREGPVEYTGQTYFYYPDLVLARPTTARDLLPPQPLPAGGGAVAEHRAHRPPREALRLPGHPVAARIPARRSGQALRGDLPLRRPGALRDLHRGRVPPRLPGWEITLDEALVPGTPRRPETRPPAHTPR